MKEFDENNEKDYEKEPEEAQEGKKEDTNIKEHKEHREHKEAKHASAEKSSANMWKITTAVLGVLLIAAVFTHGFRFGGAVAEMTSQQAADKAVNYVNGNLLQPGTTATLKSVEVKGSLYNVKFTISGREFDSFVTKDGSLLFPSAIDMNTIPKTPEAPEPAEIPKQDKAKVELFVMSQCPYGTIAEKAMAPVLDLMGSKFDFSLNFIANDNGDGTFKSLHGQAEVDEDIRQLCAAEHYPAEYFDYIICVNNDVRNAATVWEKCATDSKMDAAAIKACAEGEEGKKLLAENVKLAEQYGVSGSPTLVINGVTYNGARTADAYKSAICSGFKAEPEECKSKLSEASATASGNCGN